MWLTMLHIKITLAFMYNILYINLLPFAVHGGWGEFGDWEACPATCGGATHKRYRECNNPVPEFGGEDCTVDGSTNVETKICNEDACPGN